MILFGCCFIAGTHANFWRLWRCAWNTLLPPTLEKEGKRDEHLEKKKGISFK